MKTQTWVDQQGNNRYKTYVLVDRVELLSRPQQQQNPAQVANQYEPQYNQPPQYNEPQYQQQSIRPDGRNVTGGLNYADIKADDLPFY